MLMQGSTPSRTTTPKPPAASHLQKPDGNSKSETPYDRPCSSASYTSTTTSSCEEQVPLAFAEDADSVMNRSITKRRHGKLPSKADPIQTAILEMTNAMKNRFASEIPKSCLSPGVSTDVGFCQFILSSMAKISEGQKEAFK